MWREEKLISMCDVENEQFRDDGNVEKTNPARQSAVFYYMFENRFGKNFFFIMQTSIW